VTSSRSIGPVLETERLILRPPSAEDLEAWVAFAAHPEVAPFIGGVQSRPLAWRNLATMAGSWVIQGFGMFSVIERASGRWLGRLGPWRPEGWPGPEIACAMLPEAQGKSYAFEAMTAAIDWTFEDLGWIEIIHAIGPENTSAKRLAQRLGSRWLREDSLPEPFYSRVEIWGQTREEWRARHPR
jgi:RimJ/RimL family protein N-acetyltransferase